MRRLETGRSRVLLTLACLTALALVALPATAKKQRDDDADGKMIEFSKDDARGELLPDKALVYVMRPASIGVLVKTWAFIDDEVLGANKASSYFFVHVDPGKRTFWSKMENVDAVGLELEPGKAYFLQQHLRMGWTKARTKIEVLDEGKGEKVLARCKKRATLTEVGQTRGAELVVESRDELRADLARDAERETDER